MTHNIRLPFLLLVILTGIFIAPLQAQKTHYKKNPSYKKLHKVLKRFKYLYRKKDYKSAARLNYKMLSFAKNVYGKNHSILSLFYTYAGKAYYGSGKFAPAINSFLKSLKNNQINRRKNQLYYARDYTNIGKTYFRLKQYPRSIQYFQKSLNIKRKALGKYHNSVATLYSNIGTVYEAAGNKRKALEYYEKSLSVELYNFKKLTSSLSD